MFAPDVSASGANIVASNGEGFMMFYNVLLVVHDDLLTLVKNCDTS